jgi:hypothetical protein
MLGNLQVRFGVGVGVQSPGLHHDVIVQRFEDFTGKKAQREPAIAPLEVTGAAT